MSLRLRDYTDNTDRMQAMMDLPKAPYIKDAKQVFDPAEAVAIDMDDGGVTLPDAQYPAVGTIRLSTCIGVMAHNPNTKATGLVHVSMDGTNPRPSAASEKSLKQMMDSVKGGMDIEVEVRLVGANRGLEFQHGIMNTLLDFLAEYDAVVLSADVMRKAGPENVAVHAAYWDEGLIRGGADVLDRTNAQSGGFEALIMQRMESVDLTEMTQLPISQTDLIYDATRSDGHDLDHTL